LNIRFLQVAKHLWPPADRAAMPSTGGMARSSGQARCRAECDLRLKPQRRCWNALCHDVDHCRLAPSHSLRDSAGQLVDRLHKFTVTSERTREKIVTGWQQIAPMHAVFTIIAALEFALGVPARIVANNGNKGQLSAHRSFDFGHVEPEC